jgi:TRAP-type transport system periplasmic protein
MPVGVWPAAGGAASDTYTLRMSVAQSSTALQGIAALRLAAAVQRRSSGRLRIEVYPNLQLAKEGAIVEGLSSGVLDLAMQSSSVLVPVLPRIQIFDMPFLFKDLSSVFRVFEGPIGTEFFAQLEPHGIVGLGWGVVGFRQLETTTKAVVEPDDMKGLRIRIPSGAVYVATYQALGAIPITIDLTETFVALSQHTVDAIEINLDGFALEKYYGVAKHVAMLNHILSVTPLLGSKRKIDALPPALANILKQESKALVPFWRNLVARQTSEDIEFLKKNGVTFTEVQYAAFRKKMDPVYALFQGKLGGDFIERVSRAAGGT